MFSTPYSTLPESQAFTRRAHRMRSQVVAGLIRDFVRLISAAAR